MTEAKDLFYIPSLWAFPRLSSNPFLLSFLRRRDYSLSPSDHVSTVRTESLAFWIVKSTIRTFHQPQSCLGGPIETAAAIATELLPFRILRPAIRAFHRQCPLVTENCPPLWAFPRKSFNADLKMLGARSVSTNIPSNGGVEDSGAVDRVSSFEHKTILRIELVKFSIKIQSF